MVSPAKQEKLAIKVLEDFDDLCKALDIPHFVYAGTVLGFYRDGGFIPWDKDIDVGVICAPRYYCALIRLLRFIGFTTTAYYPDKHFYRDDIWLDIWRLGPKSWAWPYVQKFDTVQYAGRTYNTPYPIKEYLVAKYGAGWETPNQY